MRIKKIVIIALRRKTRIIRVKRMIKTIIMIIIRIRIMRRIIVMRIIIKVINNENIYVASKNP